jgi:hypothetical protein
MTRCAGHLALSRAPDPAVGDTLARRRSIADLCLRYFADERAVSSLPLVLRVGGEVFDSARTGTKGFPSGRARQGVDANLRAVHLTISCGRMRNLNEIGPRTPAPP